MTTDELKTWLNRAFCADKKKCALEELVEKCRADAQSISACGKSNDKGRCDGAKNSVQEALIRLLEKEEELITEINALSVIEDEIENAIKLLNDKDLEAVLTHRYLLFHTVEQTAVLMNYSERSVRYKHKLAIEKLCLVLHPKP